VRWIVDGEEQHRTFAGRALAGAFRSKLVTHVQRGSAFDKATGLPAPMLRDAQRRPWFAHACQYADMKWPAAAPKSRTGIAESLTTVTPALLSGERGRPSDREIRRAVYEWAFVPPRRKAGGPPPELAAAVKWLERNTITLTDLEDRTRGPELVRRALDALALKLDGRPTAAKTIARKRAIFYNALEYAVELGLLTDNPVGPGGVKGAKGDRIRLPAGRGRPAPRTDPAHRRRSPTRRGEALVAMFACMYYAAMRPS
jgi:hypothetical protein